MRLTKKLLSLLLAAVLVLGVMPVWAVDPGAQTKELLLATLSDLHYYPESLAGSKGEAFYDYLRGANCVYDTLYGVLDSAFDALAAHAKEQGLKYVVICGDLTTNGEYEGHVELADRLRAFEQSSGLKVFVINGNHDINNSLASSFNVLGGGRQPAARTSAKQFAEIYHDFGFDQADSTFSDYDTGKAGALSYALSLDGYRFIMIDAGKYSADHTAKGKDEHETGGDITPELLAWIGEQAAAAKENGETPIAFTHWNLSEMNYMHGEVMRGFVIDNGPVLQETFADMGIHYVFSGHQHVSDIDVTYSDAGEPLYSVITPTLTQYPFAFRETRFVTDAGGNVDAYFTQHDCAETLAVQSASGPIYPGPFRYAGFYFQHGEGSPSNYLTWLAKGILSPYVDEIRKKQSIVAFVEDQFGLDLEEKLDDLINGGVSVGSVDVFTVDNLMAFIDDVDSQLVKTYINNPDRLWTALGNAIRGITDMKVSDLSCTKFIGDYHFGSTERAGNLGDVLYSVIVYMYCGNERSADDAFMQDVIRFVGTHEFVDLFFATVEKYVVEDLLVNEVLANVNVHLNSVFNGRLLPASYLQFLYLLITSVMQEDVFSVESPADFATKMLSVASRIIRNESSFKELAETVLDTGLVKYGKTVKEVVYYFLDQYFDQPNKEATAGQIREIIEGCVNDPDADYEQGDLLVYSARGPVEVIPTTEDMQLPTELTARLNGNSLTLHWYTKYSVTGTDVRIADSSGAAVPAAQISAQNVKDVYTSNGFNFGSFGIMPYSREINVHTVTVSGLTPGETYTCSVGEAEKDFWSAPAEITVPAMDVKQFTFLNLNSPVATTAENSDSFAKALAAGETAYPEAAFAVVTGASALNGADDRQYFRVLDPAADLLSGMPAYYAKGANDAENTARHYGAAEGDASYYSFDYGSVHFTVLDAADTEPDGTLSFPQLLWLRKDLEASRADWKILVLGDAPFAREANDALAAQLQYLAESLAVDLILQGGAGAYSCTYMMLDGETGVSAADSIVKTINGRPYRLFTGGGVVALSGGASGSVYGEPPAEDDERFIKTAAQTAPVYTAVTVRENELLFDTYAVAEEGAQRLASYGIQKNGPRLRLGDVNQNGVLDPGDARLALRLSLGLEKNLTPVQKLAADADLSHALEPADARLILRASLLVEPIRPVMLTYTQRDLDSLK